MDTWTLQLGYPVVSVKKLNKRTWNFSQQRFTLDVAGQPYYRYSIHNSAQFLDSLIHSTYYFEKLNLIFSISTLC